MFESPSSLHDAMITVLGTAIAPFQLTHIDWRVYKLSNLSSPAPRPDARSSSSYLCIFPGKWFGWPFRISSWHSAPSVSWSHWLALRRNIFWLSWASNDFTSKASLSPHPQYLSHCLYTCSILLAFSAFSVTCWNENARSLGLCSPFSYINLSHTRCGPLLLRKTNWFY